MFRNVDFGDAKATVRYIKWSPSMSTYGQRRDDEYLNRLTSLGPISDFIKSYNGNLSPQHKTIFLFPGGMGSQLLRATADFYHGPLFIYLPAWIDPLIWAGTAVNLQTQTPPDYDDYQQHFIVPNGCIDCPPILHLCRIHQLVP
jgi:hypothetical protein